MKFLFLLLVSLQTFAAEPLHWGYALEVSERHEFYKNLEPVLKPKDSWQQLFAIVYVDGNLRRLKDCVFFKVPGSEAGVLKIKSVSASSQCEDHLFTAGDRELPGVKSLQFESSAAALKLDITFNDFRNEKWVANFQDLSSKEVPKLSTSSAAVRSPKIILLAPVSDVQVSTSQVFFKSGTVCHDVHESCEARSPSVCDQCADGWYEVPNGCPTGPKFCGRHRCGLKDRPACRRGMKWQRETSGHDCNQDSSFAYCARGLKVVCEGKRAFCR